jgi:hypothetical protein
MLCPTDPQPNGSGFPEIVKHEFCDSFCACGLARGAGPAEKSTKRDEHNALGPFHQANLALADESLGAGACVAHHQRSTMGRTRLQLAKNG